MQDTILKLCKQIHALLPTKRIAITRFVGKYEYGQIYVGELDREVKREPCNYAFYKRNFCVVYSQDPTKDQETARQDFELVCTTLQDNCPFLYDPRWYKTFFDVFETTLILEFQVWERYERKPGTPDVSMGDMEALYPIIYTGKPIVFVKFTNTTHPELDVNIPEQTFCYDGDMFVLPTVTGVYRDSDGKRWEPLAWDIGAFGEKIGPLHEDVVANLVVGEVVGVDTPMGGTVGIGENYGADIIMRLTPLSMVKTPDYRYSFAVSDFKPIGSSCDLSLDNEPNYDYAGTLSSFVPLGCGVVEPWTPPVTEKEAYFTNQGSNRTSNYNIGSGASGYQLFDPDGNHLYASEYATGENYSPVPWTMTGIYDYSGNYVSVTNRYSLKCEKSTGYLCLMPDGWVIDYHSAYKVVYKES